MKLKLAAAALNTTPINWAWNSQAIQGAIHDAAQQRAQILCLPELCITGYGCEDLFFRQHIRDTALQVAMEIATWSNAHAETMVFTLGLPLEFRGGVYNVVAVISGGKIRGFYAKQNLAGDGVHYEPRWFKPWPKDLIAEYMLPNGEIVPLGDTTFEVFLGDGLNVLEPLEARRLGKRITLGFEICEDAWVAERPGIALAKAGVDVILNPSASHFSFGKTAIRERFVTDGSRAFNCAYVYANLLGNEAGRIVYDGECLIANGGELIVKGRRFGYGRWRVTSAVVDIDSNRISRIRSASYRSIEKNAAFAGVVPKTHEQTTPPQTPPAITPWADLPQYAHFPTASREKLFEFLAAETLALFDFSRKTGTNGFVISKSGGADSAMCAILVREMVLVAYFDQVHLSDRPQGPDTDSGAFAAAFPWWKAPPVDGSPEETTRRLLTLIYQGTANSSENTLNAARMLAEEISARFEYVNVQQQVDFAEGFLTSYLGRELNWKQDDTTRQNIQARARALLPWTIANAENKLNITTSNRSEAAVGYCTMDGDTAGSIGPLGGIDKQSILDFLDMLAMRYESIHEIRNRPPTAELKPAEADQSDEKDLMPYAVLDRIERASILGGKSPEDIVAEGLGTPEQVKKFFTLFPRNQWKRERYAPSFHLDTENLDPRSYTRFPILCGGFREELKTLS